MDAIRNPFTPGAGSPPPEMVGRDPILEQARVLFARVKQGRSEKSFLLTGLRGVGKTVLLNEMEKLGEAAGFKTVSIEAHEDKTLAALLVPPLKKLLYSLDRSAGSGHTAKRALSVLKSFIGALKVTVNDIEFGLDIEPEKGAADSGDIEADLTNVFVAVAEAAKEKHSAISILIDEIQYLAHSELSALIMAMHKMQQRSLPLILIGAGLPILPAMAGESKSYAERLFGFPIIGPLSELDAAKALQEPVAEVGVQFESAALDEIFRLTKGYAYFVQEWGYQSWNHAANSPISSEIVEQATKSVIRRLDENFFRVRFDRCTPSEKKYLRAMAGLGDGPQRAGDISDALGVKVTSLGPTRSQLIKKGMIYSPAHGDMAFTVPLFDQFMMRAMPTFKPRSSK